MARPGARRNLFREAAERGYLVRNQQGAPYLIPNTDFSAGMIDLTNPAAVAWYKEILRSEVLGAGAAGYMADFGEALPYDAQLHSGEPAARFHNQYPEAWARMNRQVSDASGHGDELLFFMRSGFRQSPRDATLFWLGDQLVSWDAHDGIKLCTVCQPAVVAFKLMREGSPADRLRPRDHRWAFAGYADAEVPDA